MISDSEQNMIYVCCDCAAYTRAKFNIFTLPRNESKSFYCDNCGSELVKITTGINKYVIYVFCPMCEEFHRYTFTKQALFEKEFFTLKCPDSDCDILFVGKDADKVYAEYEKSLPFFDRMFLIPSGANIEEYDILVNMLGLLADYMRNNLVHCSCGGDHISLRYEDNSVKLVCLECERTSSYKLTMNNFCTLERAGTICIK